MNRVMEICEVICETVATIFFGVVLGVSFALVIIVAEIGLIRF